MEDRKPVLIVVAGPNGSGKTSVTSKIWLSDIFSYMKIKKLLPVMLLLCMGILFSNALRAQSLYVIHDWTGRHEKIGLIDSSGTIVVKPKFSAIEYPDFRYGPVPAKCGKKWGYIDENGKCGYSLLFLRHRLGEASRTQCN